MAHIYPHSAALENKTKVGDGNCVALVQHYTKVGHTSTWRQGERVMDAKTLLPGTVIATFVDGRYPNRRTGNHAALFLHFGPISQKTGKPQYIVVMDQWLRKDKIRARSIYPQENPLGSDDSDNANAMFVVK